VRQPVSRSVGMFEHRDASVSAGRQRGVKSAGEIGTIASTSAVVNAVCDALRPLGVQDVRMPCTPDAVWRANSAGKYGPTRLQRKMT
jgi:carbon-monoxide dehydrogenase large subunit